MTDLIVVPMVESLDVEAYLTAPTNTIVNALHADELSGEEKITLATAFAAATKVIPRKWTFLVSWAVHAITASLKDDK